MYMKILGRVVEKMEWRCLAYCLMENHIHLLIETREPNLGRGMQRIHSPYAAAFNARHGRVGHLFQGRFGEVRIDSDEQLCAVVAYLPKNPVEAGLCEAADQWPWSSHRGVISGCHPKWLDVPRLFQYLSVWGGDPRQTYLDLVHDPERGQRGQSPGTEGTVPD